MSATHVVQEEPTGLWIMGCCDAIHGWEWITEWYETKAEAERAATQHRREDREDREAVEAQTPCPTCGCRRTSSKPERSPSDTGR